MKKYLMPWLLLGYIFSLTIISAGAAVGSKEAHAPATYLKWLVGIIIVNIVCYVYTMVWTAEIVSEEK